MRAFYWVHSFFSLTSKMSHDHSRRDSCKIRISSREFHFENRLGSTRRDGCGRWLWRLVRRLCVGSSVLICLATVGVNDSRFRNTCYPRGARRDAMRDARRRGSKGGKQATRDRRMHGLEKAFENMRSRTLHTFSSGHSIPSIHLGLIAAKTTTDTNRP